MTTIEEIKQQKSQLQQTLSQQSDAVKNELFKIDSLQNKVREMQLQLQALNKVQKSCDKKNKEGLQSTILTIRNKVLLSQSQSLAKLRQQKVKKHVDVQKVKVKQIRQNQANELQNAKRENQRLKQNMMKEIKEISIKNDEIIKRTKDFITQKNRLKATNVKMDKQAYKQTLMQSKIKQMKQKHEQQMQRSRLRIEKKNQLQKKYQQLLKQKQLIQSRVQQKKQYNKTLQSLKNNISKMNNHEISKTIKEIKQKINNFETQKMKTQKMTLQQLEKDPQYVKYKLFEKYFQDQQMRRDQRDNFIF